MRAAPWTITYAKHLRADRYTVELENDLGHVQAELEVWDRAPRAAPHDWRVYTVHCDSKSAHAWLEDPCHEYMIAEAVLRLDRERADLEADLRTWLADAPGPIDEKEGWR